MNQIFWGFEKNGLFRYLVLIMRLRNFYAQSYVEKRPRNLFEQFFEFVDMNVSRNLSGSGAEGVFWCFKLELLWFLQ